ncbi:hypothetical protein CRT38_04497 [Anaplasma phagocytophilum str. CRT38]|uniref:Uncharacterized protein n=1 Tax=Anaplasma phagocytophilum str. CRT38 TaxID=1269275 RepID=S6G8B9_ANAPH|nr:hypothetical protein CRT38_04497 [Anaplasma phagocytophilum str. CRT38]KDB56911.1 hypothetical protein P030_06010 [Anaplasma phagocytophilum str. CRT35]
MRISCNARFLLKAALVGVMHTLFQAYLRTWSKQSIQTKHDEVFQQGEHIYLTASNLGLHETTRKSLNVTPSTSSI